MQRQTRAVDEKAEEVTFGAERIAEKELDLQEKILADKDPAPREHIADKDPTPKEKSLAETWDFAKYNEVKYWESDTPGGRVLQLHLCIGGQPLQHVPGITNVADANEFQDGFNRWKATNP